MICKWKNCLEIMNSNQSDSMFGDCMQSCHSTLDIKTNPFMGEKPSESV